MWKILDQFLCFSFLVIMMWYDDDEEIRLLTTLMFHPQVFLYSFFFLCFNFLNRMFGWGWEFSSYEIELRNWVKKKWRHTVTY